MISPSSVSVICHPVDRYRCLVCAHEGLAQTQDRIYCPQCGQIYPQRSDRIIDFLPNQTDPGTMTPAQAIAHVPGFGWGYDRLWRPYALSVLSGETFAAEREAALLNELIGTAAPILDLGVAAGYWSRMVLARRPDLSITGIDLSLGVLREAEQQAQPRWIGYGLLRAQAEHLPLATGSIGAVISGGSLNELPLLPTLQEIRRVLRPGGVFVSMHSRSTEGMGRTIQEWLQWTGLRFYTEAELRQVTTEVGLPIQRYLTFGGIVFMQAIRREAVESTETGEASPTAR